MFQKLVPTKNLVPGAGFLIVGAAVAASLPPSALDCAPPSAPALPPSTSASPDAPGPPTDPVPRAPSCPPPLGGSLPWDAGSELLPPPQPAMKKRRGESMATIFMTFPRELAGAVGGVTAGFIVSRGRDGVEGRGPEGAGPPHTVRSAPTTRRLGPLRGAFAPARLSIVFRYGVRRRDLWSARPRPG